MCPLSGGGAGKVTFGSGRWDILTVRGSFLDHPAIASVRTKITGIYRDWHLTLADAWNTIKIN